MTKLFTMTATVNRLPVNFNIEISLTDQEVLAMLKQKALAEASSRGFTSPQILSFTDSATQLELDFQEDESEEDESSAEYTRYTPPTNSDETCSDVVVDNLTGRQTYTPYGSQPRQPSPFTPVSHHELIPGTDYTPYRSFVITESE